MFFLFRFVVWKTINEIRKKRAVVDIRELNKLLMSDFYSLSLQSDIIANFQKCTHISVLNVAFFFYQWRAHSNDIYKQIVATFRDQKSFFVFIMSNRNSVSYVQRQMNIILRGVKNFSKTYVDDIMIRFKLFDDHIDHLRQIFEIFTKYNTFIKSTKIFLEYFDVVLLRQRINALKLIITEERLRTIAKIKFSATFKDLKHYLKLIDYIRNQIYYYFAIVKSLQNLKTSLLKSSSIANRKKFISKIKIVSTHKNMLVFENLQKTISKFSMLYYFVSSKILWINFNTFKEFEVDVIIFHFINDVVIEKNKWFSKTQILSIMFLNRQLTFAKFNYWFTELETFELIWTIKKIKHLVQNSKHRVIIQIDHQIIVDICAQTLITATNSTIRMNVKLVRAFQFFNQFNLNIRYKSNKNYIIFDALFRLASFNLTILKSDYFELNALFVYNITFVEMFNDFIQKITQKYSKNSTWKKILTMIRNNKKFDDNAADLFFSTFAVSTETDVYLKSKSNNVSKIAAFDFSNINLKQLLYHTNSLIELRRLCVLDSCIKKIMKIAHDNDHFEFAKCFEIISKAWYVRNLTKTLKQYIKHCSKCSILQIRRHRS